MPITIAQPYPNVRCLGCHGASQKFRNSPGHPKEEVPNMMAGTTSCLICHAPAHPAPKQAAAR
jgi:hypothetical protein